MRKENKIWVNGELLPAGSANISPLDRGFTLGDGLFETIRVLDGEIIRLEKHLARLRQGADIIALSLSWRDDEFRDAASQTLKANKLKDAFLRLTVSRGVPSARGLMPDEKTTNPSLIIQCGEFHGYPAELYQRGMRAIISAVRRNEHSPLSKIKSLNYLDNILARQEAAQKGADEALMLNTSGALVCASVANLFFVQGDQLITPSLHAGALSGTMRAHVIVQIAPTYGLKVVERTIMPVDLAAMDEAFLTNALMGIMPLTKVDGQDVGSGKPGTVTLGLRKILDED